MDMDPKYKNLPTEYTCKNCGTEVSVPMHCGNAMHLEKLNGELYWVCWMGTKCGQKDYNPCCEIPTIPVKEPLGY